MALSRCVSEVRSTIFRTNYGDNTNRLFQTRDDIRVEPTFNRTRAHRH